MRSPGSLCLTLVLAGCSATAPTAPVPAASVVVGATPVASASASALPRPVATEVRPSRSGTLAVAGLWACALLAGGRVTCWGSNRRGGQLGLGRPGSEVEVKAPTTPDGPWPTVDLGAGQTARSLAGTLGTMCALLEGGRVKCWGDGDATLGLGDRKTRGGPGTMGDALPFVDLGPGVKVVALSSGEFTRCALLEGGRVKCWGTFGDRLGLGDSKPRGDQPNEMGDRLPFVDLGPGARAVALSVGSSTSCALLADGRIKCWGKNTQRLRSSIGNEHLFLLGDEPGEMGDSLPAIDLGSGQMATAVAIHREHACAVLREGRVKCWGSNTWGQLGHLDPPDADTLAVGDALPFVDLEPGDRAVSLALGRDHSCALLAGGRVKCWGSDRRGQLARGLRPTGDDLNDTNPKPVTVDLGRGQQAVELMSIASDGTCARLTSGRLTCWGGEGQLLTGGEDIIGDDPSELGDAMPRLPLPPLPPAP